MPAITVENPLVLPRLPRMTPAMGQSRPVSRVAPSHRQLEGAGVEIWRPFPSQVSMAEADPFLLLDQVGPQVNGPGETAGAPWHPHRGFETVSYLLDGEIAHHDTNGGGGVIGESDTQWMTAGAGILHDELPTERAFREGGPVHGIQLWVNLPAALKFTPPRYQAITGQNMRLVTSPDGGALLRIIAGNVGEFTGPGVTHTPITYLHVTITRGAELTLPWDRSFSAFTYVLTGQGYAGAEHRPIADHELVIFGDGEHITLRAADTITGDFDALDVLILGGMRIGEPISHHAGFVMNTRQEIEQALDDFRTGRLGTIPANQLASRKFA